MSQSNWSSPECILVSEITLANSTETQSAGMSQGVCEGGGNGRKERGEERKGK